MTNQVTVLKLQRGGGQTVRLIGSVNRGTPSVDVRRFDRSGRITADGVAVSGVELDQLQELIDETKARAKGERT